MNKYMDKLTKAEDTYTFDDFLIKPGLSCIEPNDVKLDTQVSTNYHLNKHGNISSKTRWTWCYS